MSRKSLFESFLRLRSMPRPILFRWLSGLVVGAFLLAYVPSPLSRGLLSVNQSAKLQVPNDLEARTLAQFDELLRQGKIFYEESVSELYTDNGFEFEFRITPIFKKKPVLKAGDPSRSKAGGPFVDPDLDEIIIELGSSHRLLVNKYCVYRPMLVIPTTKYTPQTDDLDISDVEAAWTVLQAFETPSVIIYNCGVNAGSSQGHKHLQLFPLPKHKLWPAKTESFVEITSRIDNVLFKHFALRLPKDANSRHVHMAYQRLLQHSREALAQSDSDSEDYNVVITTEWIVVIPRRTAGPGGPFGANAAGMLGMVTVPDQQERQWWADLGYTKYLKELGVPFEE